MDIVIAIILIAMFLILIIMEITTNLTNSKKTKELHEILDQNNQLNKRLTKELEEDRLARMEQIRLKSLREEKRGRPKKKKNIEQDANIISDNLKGDPTQIISSN